VENVRVYHDRTGNTVTVWFDDPRLTRALVASALRAARLALAFVSMMAVTLDVPAEALDQAIASEQPADIIFTVKRIWTGDRDHPWAEAVAARGGAIAAVGSKLDVMRLKGPATRVIDRPTAFMVPGLIDAHGHMLSLGGMEEEIDLRGVNSPAEVAARVKEWMNKTPGDTWITGRNWDQSLWPGGAFPIAAVLDAVAPTRPVWLKRVDGHAGWANVEAMRRARVTKETQAPAGGQIIRDEKGELTGVFIDGAMGLVAGFIPGLTKTDVKRRLLAAQQAVLRNGLTGVHDAGISPTMVEAYRELERDGKLTVRIYAMASAPPRGRIASVNTPPQPLVAGSRFEMRAIKLFIDGAMGSRGALLFEPYQDDSGNSGLMLIDSRNLEAITTAALAHGWQVCTHAIGDKGNSLVLDAYSAARRAVPEARDPRLRIEHAQVVRAEDIARFAELGVIASMQPSHASSDLRWADARLGPKRALWAYAWRAFAKAGVHMAYGSDFPVEIVNPFWGLYAGVTRQDTHGNPAGGWHPEQILSLDETLAGFTAGAAYASFAENRVGTLKLGFRADLTIVDRDFFEVTPKELLATQVVMTVIDGAAVYDGAARPSEAK
jgi:predicted amidohydrolase YtcJ